MKSLPSSQKQLCSELIVFRNNRGAHAWAHAFWHMLAHAFRHMLKKCSGAARAKSSHRPQLPRNRATAMLM